MKDWNVNDPKSPNYIKNRSHWKEGDTYHTIPMECLPQEILDMYAWYLENYDTIQATIAEPSEPDPGIIK